MSGKQRRLETSAAHYYQVGFYFHQAGYYHIGSVVVGISN